MSACMCACVPACSAASVDRSIPLVDRHAQPYAPSKGEEGGHSGGGGAAHGERLVQLQPLARGRGAYKVVRLEVVVLEGRAERLPSSSSL